MLKVGAANLLSTSAAYRKSHKILYRPFEYNFTPKRPKKAVKFP
jgi:hypothetical protein